MRAAFFDLDKTVIAKSSLVALGPELHARGLLHRRTLIRAGIGQLLFHALRRRREDVSNKIRESVLEDHQGLGPRRGAPAGQRDASTTSSSRSSTPRRSS